jgi:hypothetical protein
MNRVAALYIDPRGPYPTIPGVDCWDVRRDARSYDGPLPVVAHPPCGPWGSLNHLSHGAERDCGPRAVEQVRQFGGVLEHPARSRLWQHCGLPLVGGDEVDDWGGYALEVEQVAWGHVARKRTWLYIVGAPIDDVVATVRTGGTPTHWVSGGRNQMRKNGRAGGGVVPHGIKVCSAQQRRRTPPAFAQWLVELAATAKPAISAAHEVAS